MSQNNIRHRKKTDKWRPKTLKNTAQFRYSRDVLQSLYHPSAPPEISLQQGLDKLFLQQSENPLQRPGQLFKHSLGKKVNARRPGKGKRDKKLPEWFSQDLQPIQSSPTVQETADLQNPVQQESCPDEFQIQPIFLAPEQEKTPEKKQEDTLEQSLLPAYDYQVLNYHKSIGNPFATILLDQGKWNDNYVYLIPFTKPYEKVWFYKDPVGKIQGPFSSIEMFNWTMHGCFPMNLEIAMGNQIYFVPMNVFSSQRLAGKKEMKSEPKKQQYRNKEEATMALRSMLGMESSKKAVQTNKYAEKPKSFADLQRELSQNPQFYQF